MGTLVILGTIGNGLTLIVMRRGSLRNVSTCFYMAVLAVADTGECGPIFLKFLEDMSLFVGPLIPLFWTYDDVSTGFQSQGGSLAYMLCRLRAMNS